MSRFFFVLVAACAAIPAARGALLCQTSSVPAIVHAVGLSERMGDIGLSCTGGQPGAPLTVNLDLFLSVNITNRLAAGGAVNAILTIDNAPDGSAPNPVQTSVQPTLVSNQQINWSGLAFTLSPSGSVRIVISNVRGNANQAGTNPIVVQIAASGPSTLPLTRSQLTVGIPQASLFRSFSSVLVCNQKGAPLPDTLTVSNLIAAGAYFSSTRLTEGFSHAFMAKTDPADLNADTGTRFIARFSGFPPGARLLAPDYVAGSTADIPTAGGDMGVPASGGRYTPGKSQLLLIRVNGADQNGAGGTLAGPIPTAQTTFDTVADVGLTDGAGYLVYEVVDSNPSARESAQFPVWLGADPILNGQTYTTAEEVYLAPVSDVQTASATAPIPRFTAVQPQDDCSLIGDCKAPTQLAVDQTSVLSTTPSNVRQYNYVHVQNLGRADMPWNATVNYTDGSGWLIVSPSSHVNNSWMEIAVDGAGLAPGTYKANVVVDAGAGGTQTIAVTAKILAPRVASGMPVIEAVTSSADPYTAAADRSLATLWGQNLKGSDIRVTIDGQAATVLYDGDSQINVMVPDGVAIGTSSKVVANVNGVESPVLITKIVPLAPAIFPGAVLNYVNPSTYVVNGASNPAKPGSVVVVYATGIADAQQFTLKIGDSEGPAPQYAGPAPTLPGVQQINFTIPANTPAGQATLSICGNLSSDAAARFCSSGYQLWVAQP